LWPFDKILRVPIIEVRLTPLPDRCFGSYRYDTPAGLSLYWGSVICEHSEFCYETLRSWVCFFVGAWQVLTVGKDGLGFIEFHR